MIGRRGFITGLVALVAAPAIVRAGSLMPVKIMIEPVYGVGPVMRAIDGWSETTLYEISETVIYGFQFKEQTIRYQRVR